MTGLGCTVGTLFSGTPPVRCRVFGASLFTGTAVTLWSGRRLRPGCRVVDAPQLSVAARRSPSQAAACLLTS